MKIRLHDHLKKCINLLYCSSVILFYNISINMHTYGLSMMREWLIYSSAEPRYLIFLWIFASMFWMSGDSILAYCSVYLNFTTIWALIFCCFWCLTQNILKNHTYKCIWCHTGTKQVNISDHFILVMPRPFEKCIVYQSFHEKVIYVVDAR